MPFSIDDLSSGSILAMPSRSNAFIGPSGSTPSAPCRPSRTLQQVKGSQTKQQAP